MFSYPVLWLVNAEIKLVQLHVLYPLLFDLFLPTLFKIKNPRSLNCISLRLCLASHLSHLNRFLSDLHTLRQLRSVVIGTIAEIPYGLFYVFLTEVGAADRTAQILYAPRVNAGSMKDVSARSSPDGLGEFHVLQTNRADLLFRPEAVSRKGGHKLLEVFEIIGERSTNRRERLSLVPAGPPAPEQNHSHPDDHDNHHHYYH